MATRLKNEPALLLGLVQAVLAVAVSFGLSLSAQQVGAIVALTAAATAVVVRRQVTPVAAGGAIPPAHLMPISSDPSAGFATAGQAG